MVIFKIDRNYNIKSKTSISESFYIEKTKENNSSVRYKAKLDTIMSDFDNFKEKKSEEIKNIYENSSKKVIINILGVFDNLENALLLMQKKQKEYVNTEFHSTIKSINTGLLLIMKNMSKKLRTLGLLSINALGTTFDPSQHEAIKNTYETAFENEAVLEEYQKGYILNNKLLRASKVVVNINI